MAWQTKVILQGHDAHKPDSNSNNIASEQPRLKPRCMDWQSKVIEQGSYGNEGESSNSSIADSNTLINATQLASQQLMTGR